jgi:LmbE family N-acetylglucosaminyl deacetylase
VIVVLSPHTDDAIFSLGAHLTTLEQVVIASVFAGVPSDPDGNKKHTTLLVEHIEACTVIGAQIVNADFLDDVYPRPPLSSVRDWIFNIADAADTVYIPLGIHHPDHILTTAVALHSPKILAKACFYEELPYRTDYPQLAAQRLTQLQEITGPLEPVTAGGDHELKLKAVRRYASQTDQDVINRVMVPEHVWQAA